MTVRIAVVGCARILPAHLRGLKSIQERGLADFRITALCARRAEDALMFRARGEGPPPRAPVTTLMTGDPLHTPHMYVSDLHTDILPAIYTDWRAAVEAPDVDAVLNLTPVYLHHTVTLAALQAGKHVLVEKPLAITVRAGWLMVEAARARDLVLGVAENARYARGTRMSRWALDSGLIGDVQMWIGGGMGAPDWSPDVIVAKTAWRHRKTLAGGGPALDGAVHTFDVIRYLCGEVSEVAAMAAQVEPIRVVRDKAGDIIQAVTNEVEDVFFASFRCDGGAVGTLFGGLAGHGQPTGMPDGPVIYGTRGCLVGGVAVLDGGARIIVDDHFTVSAPPGLVDQWFPQGLTDPFGLEMLGFLRAVADGHPIETSGAEGLRDIACSLAVLEASEARRTVRVADVLDCTIDGYQRDLNEHYGL
jgi:predicted dehydrogenase